MSRFFFLSWMDYLQPPSCQGRPRNKPSPSHPSRFWFDPIDPDAQMIQSEATTSTIHTPPPSSRWGALA